MTRSTAIRPEGTMTPITILVLIEMLGIGCRLVPESGVETDEVMVGTPGAAGLGCGEAVTVFSLAPEICADSDEIIVVEPGLVWESVREAATVAVIVVAVAMS